MPSIFRHGKRLLHRNAHQESHPRMEAPTISQDELFEEENLADYDASEFYPVKIDEVFQQRYSVIGKLGYGANSTVWLCRDSG
jgi:serine/threonine-protein kinase SRPK3